MPDIMTCFPAVHKPRQAQTHALTELERVYASHDVIVIRAPTATGKTDLAATVARWINKTHKKKTSLVVPNKVLVSQFLDSFPRMSVLRSKADYGCDNPSVEIGPRGGVTEHRCLKCRRCKEFLRDNRRVRVVPYCLSNYWVYYSYKLFNHTLVADEAHNLLDMLKSLGAKQLWREDYGFPTDCHTYADLLGWAEHEARRFPDKKLDLLVTELKSHQPSTTLNMTYGERRGKGDHVVQLLPLNVRHMQPLLWPRNKVKKIVLMSATIGPQDIYDLGLDTRRVAYIDCDSPIPAERRPIVYSPVANMALKHHTDSLPKVAEYIHKVACSNQDTRGLVHATYAVAAQLRELLSHNPRFIFHSHHDKREQFAKYKATPNAVFVASGMAEGVDLKHELGGWQVVTQIPWPSLEDLAVITRMEADPEWYQWQTVKAVLQMSGRICRTPTDYGETHIIDTQWERLRRVAAHMFPQWYKDAIVDSKL